MGIQVCRICNSSSFDEMLEVKEMMFGSGKLYKYEKCSNCGTLQIATPIHDSEQLYPKHYYSFSFSRNSFKIKIKKLLSNNAVASELGLGSVISSILKRGESKEARSLKGFIKKGDSILDVGCGSGKLLGALFALGFKRVKGIDPFIAEDIVHPGWKVQKAFITDLDEKVKYDLIMLHHSFEHMENPKEVLQKIKTLLSPKGKCIIRIPVCDSYAYDTYKENWYQVDAPRHVFLHTTKSMQLLCNQTGLKLAETKDDSGMYQFICSEQYKKGISLNAPNSYFKLPFYKQSIFTKDQVTDFKRKSEELNKANRGDQRIFVITK